MVNTEYEMIFATLFKKTKLRMNLYKYKEKSLEGYALKLPLGKAVELRW